MIENAIILWFKVNTKIAYLWLESNLETTSILNTSCFFCCRTPPLHWRKAGYVVPVNCKRSRFVSLRDEDPPDMCPLVVRVRQSYQLGLRAPLGYEALYCWSAMDCPDVPYHDAAPWMWPPFFVYHVCCINVGAYCYPSFPGPECNSSLPRCVDVT